MNTTPFGKITLIVIVALLIPVLTYTGFQLVQSNKTERLIRSIYQRQLDSILFSVNQHCWDIWRSWSIELDNIASRNTAGEIGSNTVPMLEQFVNSKESIEGAFLRLSGAKMLLVWGKNRQSEKASRLPDLNQLLDNASARITTMLQRAKEGYVKPLTIFVEEKQGGTVPLLVFWLPSSQHAKPILAGLFIDDMIFIDRIIARKFSEIEESNFEFAVRQHNTGEILYPTEPQPSSNFEKEETLWILPHLDLLIKLRGTTLQQIANARTRTNLIFLISMNIVLILGILYLLKNISKEMTLARMKTDFVANVSHELRTPLALIRMHAETLEMGRVPSEERKQQYYKTIMSESTRLTQLINNILDFSKIESHKKEYHLEQDDIKECVIQTLGVYGYHLHTKGFQLEQKIDSSVPKIVMDREAVTQALINLLDNAVKFSQNEKKIIVMLESRQNHVVLSVQDFGVGIAESEHKKIFDKFYRVENSLIHNTKGSGLGLNLVKHIMDVHNGKVTVTSQVGVGSTFSLSFPKE